MKKLFNVIFLSCLLSFGFAAEYNKSVDFFTATKNVSSSDKKWLSEAVENRLKSGFAKYTNMSITDDADSSGKSIINFYKKADAFEFNERTIIEVRNLSSADYGVFTNVIFDNGTYSLSSRFIDIYTGEVIAYAESSYFKSPEHLYLYSGCGADEIIIYFFETLDNYSQFNLLFSPTVKKFILHGEGALLREEKNAFYEDMIDFYNNEISLINVQIKNLSHETNKSSLWITAEQIRLKGMQNRIKENLKVVKRILIGLYDEAIVLKKDESKDLVRSYEQIEKINSEVSILNEKYYGLRSSQTENCSIFDRIKILELKKRYFAEMYSSFESEKQSVLDNAKIEISETKEAFDNNTYYDTLNKGQGSDYTYTFIDEPVFVEVNEKKTFREVKKEILDNARNKIKQLELDINRLADEINNDYAMLKNNFISTVGSELFVSGSKFDTSSNCWTFNITLKNDGLVLFNTDVVLEYEALTGKKPVTDFNTEGFDEFIDNVDFYDSLFLRGAPIFIFELEYSVTPMDSEDSVEYLFNFNGLKYYDTKTATMEGSKIKSSYSGYFDIKDFQFIKELPLTYDLDLVSYALSKGSL